MTYINYQPVNDQNTIRILNVKTSRNQINSFLRNYVDMYYDFTSIQIVGKWRISLIPHLKIAYVYFSNPELFHIFLGNNPDGSRRFKCIPNPSYRSEMVKDDSIIKNIYLDTPEYINVPCENPVPLCKLNSVNPKIEPVILRNKKDVYQNVLVCSKAPKGLDRSYIYDLFSFYVKDKSCEYPKIQIINHDRHSVIEVTYAPDSIDGMFALIMMRKVEITYKDKSYTLVFDYKPIST